MSRSFQGSGIPSFWDSNLELRLGDKIWHSYLWRNPPFPNYSKKKEKKVPLPANPRQKLRNSSVSQAIDTGA